MSLDPVTSENVTAHGCMAHRSIVVYIDPWWRHVANNGVVGEPCDVGPQVKGWVVPTPERMSKEDLVAPFEPPSDVV